MAGSARTNNRKEQEHMSLIAEQCGRFMYWLSQGQNATIALVIATIALVLVTAWYAYLTHRMSKAVLTQARAMLQPVLALQMQYTGGSFAPNGCFEIRNLGTQPVVLLDVRLRCFPWGAKSIQDVCDGLVDNIVPPEGIKRGFDFSQELGSAQKAQGAYSYELLVVASDVGRQVVVEYGYLPVLEMHTCRRGEPLRVKLRYAARRLKHWYYRWQRRLSRGLLDD
jgi:hypothetical protein